MPFTPSMKLNTLTNPVIHTAAATASRARRYRRVHRQDEQPRDDGTPGGLERQPADSGQPAQVVDEAEHAEETDRGRERGTCARCG